MQLKICITRLYPQTIYVPSSDGARLYHITTPTLYSQGICDPDCKGYRFRGHCKHLEQVQENLCTFASTNLDIVQCPLCGKEAIEFEYGK